jgi:hypothetical protein
MNRDRKCQAGGNVANTNSPLHIFSDNQLILYGQTLATILFKTSAFVLYNSNLNLICGGGRIQDLFETMLEVLSQLNEALRKELPDIMTDILHLATMQ